MPHRGGFQPQRLYPRYAPLAAIAARTNTSFSAFRKAFSFTFDKTRTDSDLISTQLVNPREVLIVGFPRTGTTFLQFALQSEFTKGDLIFKVHDVMSIPKLAEHDIPVLVPLRNPFDTCVSWSIYNSDPLSKRFAIYRLNTYLAWHRLLLRNANYANVKLINFADLTSNLESVLNSLNIEGRQRITDTSISTHKLLDDLSTQQASEDVEVNFQNTPSEVRHENAMAYQAIYSQLANHRVMKKCNAIYAELSSYINEQQR